MGRLIEGGGVGRPDGKNLQILDLHRLASLSLTTRLNSQRLPVTQHRFYSKVIFH